MSSSPYLFNASLRRMANVTIIDLQGEIVASSETTLLSAYEAALRQKANHILLNFAQVDYINSGGIARLVMLIRQASHSGHQLLACDLTSYYADLFEITRLNEYIDIYSDEAAALAEVNRGV